MNTKRQDATGAPAKKRRREPAQVIRMWWTVAHFADTFRMTVRDARRQLMRVKDEHGNPKALQKHGGLWVMNRTTLQNAFGATEGARIVARLMERCG